jgi:starch synthase
MRVLYVACELNPLIKVGGLADVTAALPSALLEQSVDVRVLLPGLPLARELVSGLKLLDSIDSPFGVVQLLGGKVPASGVPVYIVHKPALFDRPGSPYVDPDGNDWADNHRRFGLLSWVAAHFRDPQQDWTPDIVHCHDWHTALAPAYLHASGNKQCKSVLTIHNLAYQGNFKAQVFNELALPKNYFSIDGLEFFNQVSFMKAGIVFADKVTTVSPQYAYEIQTLENGCGFEGLLRLHQPAGILNGVDYREWSPDIDSAIAEQYGVETIERKAACKRSLQQELKLDVSAERPLFVAVSRLTWQKGLDLIIEALPELIASGAQFALLGTGERALEEEFIDAVARFPGSAAFVAGYDEKLAHRMMAGADVIALPSRFEPCGLTQLYGLRYGTLPLVRRVGGLADSVLDATPVALQNDSATGFMFDEATSLAFLHATRRATECFRDKSVWLQLQRRAMMQDFSWAVAAARYIAVYQSLGSAPRPALQATVS